MAQQLRMIWPANMAANKTYPTADGYRVRPLRDGDEAGHVTVMRVAGFTKWDEAQLAQWRTNMTLPDGIFVAIHKASNTVVATALAAHRPTPLHPSGGELGWVAADPSHAGKGLGQAVCTAALQRLLEAGYHNIYLSTDDWRLAAIKTYLKMGFVPFICATDMESRWLAVAEKLQWPLTPAGMTLAPSDLWYPDPIAKRPDDDKVERYPKRHKWLPQREHRGFACNGDVDTFGDESLYQPSRLGSACIAPAAVKAGATSPLTITLTVGADGLASGTKITFVMRGQSPLGYISKFALSTSGNATLEKTRHGFTIANGSLNEGDTVTLAWPPFAWTPIAARREFKVVFAFGDNRPEQRLPAPLVVDITPLEPAVAELTTSLTHRPDSAIATVLTIRDKFDNPVSLEGEVELTTNGDKCKCILHNGRCEISLPSGQGEIIRVGATTPLGTCLSNPSRKTDGAQLYIGDLHCHDFMSEAEGYPDQVYRWAIEERKLDFVSIVPQAHGWLDNETWTVAKYMNERYLNEGRFVTFLGFEWQHTGYGDKVVHYLGGDQPFLPPSDPRYDSAAGLYQALRGNDALIISHHSAYPPGNWCSSTDFEAVESDVERLVELWSMHGSSEGYNTSDRPLVEFDPAHTVYAALRRGVRLGFSGGSDTHSGRPGGSPKEPRPYWGGLTAVWADSLTRRDIFRALHARRTYALTRARIGLRFTVNGHPMGAEIPLANEAAISVEAWAPAAIAQIEIMKNTAVLRTFTPNASEAKIDLTAKPGGAAFYHCRVTLSDGNLAVCSPVWLS